MKCNFVFQVSASSGNAGQDPGFHLWNFRVRPSGMLPKQDLFPNEMTKSFTFGLHRLDKT
jgi:hypothetical protein